MAQSQQDLRNATAQLFAADDTSAPSAPSFPKTASTPLSAALPSISIPRPDPQKVKEFDDWKKGAVDVIEKDRQKIGELPGLKTAELQKAPEMEHTDPMKTWGSTAMLIATVGSLFTRRPMLSALNAASGVMKAKNDADATAYKQAVDKWKIENENAFKLVEEENKKIQDMYSRLKNDPESLHTELEILSKQYQDPALEMMVKTNQAEAAAINKNIAALKYKKEAELNEIQSGAFTQALDDFKAENGRDANPSEFNNLYIKTHQKVEKEAAGLPTWSDEAIEKAADAVAGGLKLSIAVPGFGKNNPNRDAVMNKLAEKYPDINLADIEADYAGTTSEKRAVGTASGKLKLSANLLDKAIPLAREAISKVDLTNYPSINALENAARTQTGNPALAAANTALQTVMSDYSALIARNGVSTDATRAAAHDLVNKNMAKGQLNAVFDQMERERDNILEAVQDTKANKVSSSDLKNITTQEEFDALPSGSEYLEDGKKYRKP